MAVQQVVLYSAITDHDHRFDQLFLFRCKLLNDFQADKINTDVRESDMK